MNFLVRCGRLLPVALTLAATAATAAPAADTQARLLAELQQRVARLESETRQLRTQLNAGGRVLPHAASAETGSPAGPPGQAERDAMGRAAAEVGETAFRQEPLDPRWSHTTAMKVQQVLAASSRAGGPSVRGLECRSRSCRLELEPMQPGQIDAFISEFAARLAGTLNSISAGGAAGDGGQPVVLYLSS